MACRHIWPEAGHISSPFYNLRLFLLGSPLSQKCRGLSPALLRAVSFASSLWSGRPEKISFSMVWEWPLLFKTEKGEMRHLADYIRIAGIACFFDPLLCSWYASCMKQWSRLCAFTVQIWSMGVSSIQCEESCLVCGTHLSLYVQKISWEKPL